MWKSDGDGDGDGAGRLVQKINKSIGQDLESKYLIGVLDIYGFESFQNNRQGRTLPQITASAHSFCSVAICRGLEWVGLPKGSGKEVLSLPCE